jgi:hypothetical protein
MACLLGSDDVHHGRIVRPALPASDIKVTREAAERLQFGDNHPRNRGAQRSIDDSFTMSVARCRTRSATAMVMFGIAAFCCLEIAFGLALYRLEAPDCGAVGG